MWKQNDIVDVYGALMKTIIPHKVTVVLPCTFRCKVCKNEMFLPQRLEGFNRSSVKFKNLSKEDALVVEGAFVGYWSWSSPAGYRLFQISNDLLKTSMWFADFSIAEQEIEGYVKPTVQRYWGEELIWFIKHLVIPIGIIKAGGMIKEQDECYMEPQLVNENHRSFPSLP